MPSIRTANNRRRRALTRQIDRDVDQRFGPVVISFGGGRDSPYISTALLQRLPLLMFDEVHRTPGQRGYREVLDDVAGFAATPPEGAAERFVAWKPDTASALRDRAEWESLPDDHPTKRAFRAFQPEAAADIDRARGATG